VFILSRATASPALLGAQKGRCKPLGRLYTSKRSIGAWRGAVGDHCWWRRLLYIVYARHFIAKTRKSESR
jgi:hypothetical protein